MFCYAIDQVNQMIKTRIDALLIGGPKPFRADGTQSAIDRIPAHGPAMLTKLGFSGDEVADKKVHGGPDKALHLYPAEHYPFWTVKLAGHALLASAGAFGENISATGLSEDKVKIGDRFRMGHALVEISQGRQPCWKIDHRFGVRGLSGEFIKTGRCGLYFRVIEEGVVAVGDVIEQVEMANHEWTVERVFDVLIGGGHRQGNVGDGDVRQALHALINLETLAGVWRHRAAALLVA